jgi:hypothetical protein
MCSAFYCYFADFQEILSSPPWQFLLVLIGDDALLLDEKVLPHYANCKKLQLILISLMENKQTLGCAFKSLKTLYFLLHRA